MLIANRKPRRRASEQTLELGTYSERPQHFSTSPLRNRKPGCGTGPGMFHRVVATAHRARSFLRLRAACD
jgi:hypothetical protein